MHYWVAIPIFLLGCSAGPGPLPEASQIKHAKIERVDQEEYSYLLMLNSELVETHYWGLRFVAAEMALEGSELILSDKELRYAAVEYVACEIAETLDKKYGDCIKGEVMPLLGLILIKSEVPVDLTCLKGWLDD